MILMPMGVDDVGERANSHYRRKAHHLFVDPVLVESDKVVNSSLIASCT
jgi:hypothetical protein